MAGKKSKTSERAASIGAATPKDHMEAEAAGGGTVEVTVQGLTIEVDPTAVSGDWEVVEALADLEDGTASPGALVRVTKAALGDTYDDVKAHLRRQNGRINADDMAEFLKEVFESLNLGN